jgi:hypothetical protein
LITLLITLQIRHAGMPFLSVFANRADGSNPTAPVNKMSSLERVDSFLFYLEEVDLNPRSGF